MITNEIAEKILETLRNGGKVFLAGNGGSSDMCNHLVGELVGKGYPIQLYSLASNIPVITAIANDYSYDEIFSRQLQSYAKKGDLLITLSTSGKSNNIQLAHMHCIKYGIESTHFPIRPDGKATPKTQELHLAMVHEIAKQVEQALK